MPDMLGNPCRRGASGRIPDSQRDSHRLYERVQATIDPETYDRLKKFCDENDRARSWCIQKALGMWLDSQGY